MVEKQIVLLFIFAILFTVSLAISPKNGYNVYKDDDKLLEMFSDDGISDKVYFYRPVAAYSDLAESFGKRTVNKFKNIMLTKDMDIDEPLEIEKELTSRFYFPRTVPKRGSILSWALPAANRVREMNINSLNPPGFNRPAAAA